MKPVTPPVIQFCNPFVFLCSCLLPASSSGHGRHGHLTIVHAGGGALAVRLHLHHRHQHLHVLAGHAHHAHQAPIACHSSSICASQSFQACSICAISSSLIMLDTISSPVGGFISSSTIDIIMADSSSVGGLKSSPIMSFIICSVSGSAMKSWTICSICPLDKNSMAISSSCPLASICSICCCAMFMAISSMTFVPLEAAPSTWPRSPPLPSWPRSPPPLKSCLRATLDTLLVGSRLRPRAEEMALEMALVMAVWTWLLRTEMRMAPMILSFTTGTGLTLNCPFSTFFT